MNTLSSPYREFAQNMAQEAGKIMKRYYSLGMEKGWKGDRTLVTKADLEINHLLLEKVQCVFPTHNVRSEEGSSEGKPSEYCWVCDPIDGTAPFCHGMPISTFSLALVKNGESILGVVYDPFADRLFIGEKGMGTMLNGKNIRVSSQAELRGALCDIEAHYTHPYHAHTFVEHLCDEERVHCMRMMSFIYPSVLVAAGEVTCTVFPGDTVHDVAAVKVIVEEAGGRVTDLFGNEQRYDRPVKGAIVSNGVVHEYLVELSKKYIYLRA